MSTKPATEKQAGATLHPSGRPPTIAAGELLVEKLTETGSEDIRAMTPLV